MAVRRAALSVHSLEDRAVPAAGSPDLTFGAAGLATAGFATAGPTADAARAVAVDAAGKLVVAGTVDGDFAVFRYNADGSLDPSFGTGGKAVADLGGPADAAYAVAIQADGKIVVAGETMADGTNTFAVARFTAVGALDTSFDGDGKVVAHLAFAPSFGNQPLDSSARAVAIQPDGRIVVAGYSREETNPGGFGFQFDEQYAVVRLLPTGAFDPAFNGGKTLAGSHDNVDIAAAVLVQPDGRVVVAGETRPLFGGPSDFGLARLTAAGALDGGFGAGGLAAIGIGFGFGTDVATGLALVGSDLVVGGYTLSGFQNGDLALARLDAAGQPVPTFGTFGNGTTTVDLGGDDRANALVPAGPHVVLAGSTTAQVAGTSDFVTTWVNPATGQPDVNVAFNGTAFTDFGTADDVAFGAVVAGGRVVAVGSTTNNNGDFALAGYTALGVADPTFSGDGRAATNAGTADREHDDQAFATLVQPDGKVVVAGRSALGATDSALARFNRDGTPDATFGANGRVLASVAGFDQVLALARQPDGKILAAGQADFQFFLARFTPEGNLDSTFDTDGRVLVTVPTGGGAATALARMPDGRIVVAGDANGSVAVARYLPDGQPDPTFDFDGLLVDPGANTVPIGAHVGADGSVLVVGSGTLVRYLADGRLDLSFGSRGRWVRPPVLSGVQISASALQPDGKILVAGAFLPPTGGFDFLVARLNPNGSIDPAFGGAGTGVKVIDFGPASATPSGLALQADGKVVVAGTFGPDRYAVARLTPVGTTDATFGANGQATGPLGAPGVVSGLALQANGKINLGGTVAPELAADFVAVQLRGDNTLPVTTGLGPVTVSEDAAPTVLNVDAAYSDAQDTNAHLTYTLVSNTVTNGAVTAELVDGVLTLTYAPDRYGTGAVTVRATDLDGGSTDTVIGVTVARVNDLPTAVDDAADATDQAPVTIDVLANDTDADLNDPAPDTDRLTITSVSPATFGTVAIVNNKIRYTPRLNADGVETLTYTITDRAGTESQATLTITVSDVTVPRVLDVRAYYAPNKFVRLVDRPANLGWSSIQKFQVVFSEPVDVQADDLTLTGVTLSTYDFAAFSYNAATFTATWTLTNPIAIDRLTLKLDGTTADGVADAPGENRLGTDVVRRFGVLPGDLDGNGLVTAVEATRVKSQVGKRYPTIKGADVDGDGVVTARDYAIVKLNVGKRLP